MTLKFYLLHRSYYRLAVQVDFGQFDHPPFLHQEDSHFNVKPPSTTICAPVMKLDAAEAQNT